ncbi:hypothetical protein [Hydrogenovibrio marinus]|uniref:hypothetical protein n=2 Tax=Hydrogenovibrio marinus TaxID=28885 RepID=UPI001EE1C86C|nr:hypothetical protein [Hydrogenovibrio marinus]
MFLSKPIFRGFGFKKCKNGETKMSDELDVATQTKEKNQAHEEKHTESVKDETAKTTCKKRLIFVMRIQVPNYFSPFYL